MANEEKTEKVKIGRPVEFENTVYGKGEYMVTPRVARALRNLNATASVASHMATEREKIRRQEEEEAKAAETGEGGGEGAGGTGGTVGQAAANSSTGGTSAPDGGGAVTSSTPSGGAAGGGGQSSGGGSEGGGESLKGALPEDFPARDKLANGAPEAEPPIPPVTTYEQLTGLSKEELDSFPGIGEATIEQIGQRLLSDAQAAGVKL